ncbi:hypothetical protein IWX81_001807 [Salinibacterium sp. CAN_S4]|uniref:hypothetical protein n=1 Tax=Salinibacterium sp. CAN_S4 TaxID=2787727 RepID=UPI0018EF4F37
MASDSPDDTSDERELQRLAYSRPVDGVDPTAAQTRLAALAEARTPPPEIEWHTPPLPTAVTRREKVIVAVAASVALGLAGTVALAPVSSLVVFDRPQSDAPVWPGGGMRDARTDKIRWIASGNGWDVFAFVTTGGNICVAGFEGKASAGGACTSESVFDIIGLRLGMSRTVGDSAEYFSVRWGPAGTAETSELPLVEWSR